MAHGQAAALAREPSHQWIVHRGRRHERRGQRHRRREPRDLSPVWCRRRGRGTRRRWRSGRAWWFRWRNHLCARSIFSRHRPGSVLWRKRRRRQQLLRRRRLRDGRRRWRRGRSNPHHRWSHGEHRRRSSHGNGCSRRLLLLWFPIGGSRRFGPRWDPGAGRRGSWIEHPSAYFGIGRGRRAPEIESSRPRLTGGRSEGALLRSRVRVPAGNQRSNQIVDAQIKVVLLRTEQTTGKILPDARSVALWRREIRRTVLLPPIAILEY